MVKNGKNVSFFYMLINRFPIVSNFQNGVNDPLIIYGYRIMSKNVAKMRKNQGVKKSGQKWSKMAKNDM